MAITIKDIAKMANVSVTTVSLVLNEKKSRISDKKKEEIVKIAKENEYVPNFSARNLVKQKSMTIGIVIPNIENLFFSRLAKTVEDSLRKHEYTLIFADSNESYINDISIVKKMSSFGVDGLIITFSYETYKYKKEYIEALEKTSIPFVLIDRTFNDYDCDQVYFDDELGGYLAMNHVLSLGHKDIACLTTKRIALNGFYRYQGYQKALDEYKIVLDENMIFDSDSRYDSGYHFAEKILENKKITAIITANDLEAYGVIRKAREKKISVPNDLLVVGYDNLGFSDMMGINLPSVEQNVFELGETAVQILMDKINKVTDRFKKVKLIPKLVTKNT